MTRASWLHEPVIYFGYVSTVLRPGAIPPAHPLPQAALPEPPAEWTDEDRNVFISEARRRIDTQQSDKRDIRSRSQVVLSTTLLLAATIVATYISAPHHAWYSTTLYCVALILVASAVMASAGILTARSDIGAAYLPHVTASPPTEALTTLTREYAAVTHIGANTVAVMVTALRTTVMVTVASFAVFACAYALTR